MQNWDRIHSTTYRHKTQKVKIRKAIQSKSLPSPQLLVARSRLQRQPSLSGGFDYLLWIIHAYPSRSVDTHLFFSPKCTTCFPILLWSLNICWHVITDNSKTHYQQTWRPSTIFCNYPHCSKKCCAEIISSVDTNTPLYLQEMSLNHSCSFKDHVEF